MGIIKTQSIYNSVIIYIGIGLGFISTIYLYPNILNTEQYGLTRLLLSVSFIFTQFAHLGMKNIAIKYFPYFNDKANQHNGFFFISLIVSLVGFLLFLVILYLFSDFFIAQYSNNSELFIEYFWFLIPLVFGILYFDVVNSYVRARYDSVPGTIIHEIILRAIAIVLLGLFYYEWIDFYQFMFGFVASYLIQPLLLLVHLFKKGELFIRPKLRFLTTNLIKRMSNYGLYVILGGMATLIVNNIDIIMLGSLTGLSDTGIYAIAFYIGSVIVVPQRSIGKIAPPLIAKHLKEQNLDEIRKIYKSSSINQLIPGFLLFIGIWANLDNLIEILPNEYSSADWVIVIIGFSKLIDMAAGVNGTIILNSRYFRFDLLSTIFLVFFSIALNYMFIPSYGIVGAALATVASMFIYNLIKGIYVWKKFKMQPFTPKVLIVIGLSCALLLLSFQVDRIGGLYLDIFIRSIVIAVIFSAGILFFNVSEEVNKTWDEVKKRTMKLFS